MVWLRFVVASVVMASMMALSGCAELTATTVSSSFSKVSSAGIESGGVGNAVAEETSRSFKVIITIDAGSGLSAGEHGVHIHANPDCEAGPANATSTTNIAAGKAGGHWNPTNAKHGMHAGDLGNINIASDGSGTLTVTSFQAPLTLEKGGTYSVRGHSVVVHAQKDDGVTDPSGNSGGRALCAVWPA